MEPTDNQNPAPQVPDFGQMPPIPARQGAGGDPSSAPAPADMPSMTLPLPPAPGQPAAGQPDPAQAPAGQPTNDPFAATQPADPSQAQTPTNIASEPPQKSAKNDDYDTTPLANPQVVDDGDLIEKEWVHKAKQIVDRNRNDPYKQNEELAAFKADYMKKRYNKNVKLDE